MESFVSSKGNPCFKIDEDHIVVVFPDKREPDRFRFVSIINGDVDRFSNHSYQSVEAALDAFLEVHNQ